MTQKRTVNQLTWAKRTSWLFRGISAILLFLIFLFFILHIPSVQKAIGNRISSFIVDSNNGKIAFDQIKFDVFKGIQLYNVSISDKKDKNLLRADLISISPRSSFFSLFRKSLSLNEIALDGVSIDLSRMKGEGSFDLLELFEKDGTSSQDGSNYSVVLSHVNIKDFNVCIYDAIEGFSLEAHLAVLELSLNKMYGKDTLNAISLNKLLVDRPNISLNRFDPAKLIDSSRIASLDSTDRPRSFDFNTSKLHIINGDISYHNAQKSIVSLQDFDFIARDLKFNDINHWAANIEELSFKSDGLNLSHFEAINFSKNGPSVQLQKGSLSLNGSSINFELNASNLEDLSSLSKANYELKISPSHFKISDLFFISSDLKNALKSEPISQQNIQFQGTLNINNEIIDAKNIVLWMNSHHFFEGNAELYVRSPFKRSTLFANVSDMRTDLVSLDALFDKINIPNEIKRLGKLNFKGKFEGELNDFHAQGEVLSDLGELSIDVDMDQRVSRNDSLINFSGVLNLKSFDLKKFLLNDDFGLTDGVFQIKEGVGKDLINSSAALSAQIDQFYFKGYNYKNALYDGYLSSKVINGKFAIKDENVDFEFSGIVDLSKDIPIYDFSIDANKINFCVLNITDFPCEVSFKSDFNLRGKNASSIIGSANIDKLRVVFDTSELNVQKIRVTSSKTGSNMDFVLLSDYLDAHLTGEFNLLKFAQSNLALFAKNNHEHEKILNRNFSADSIYNHNVRYDIAIKRINPVLKFLKVDATISGETSVKGFLNTSERKMQSRINVPVLSYKGIETKDVDVYLESGRRKSIFHISSLTNAVSNVNLEAMSFEALLTENMIDWNFEISRDNANYIALVAKSDLSENGYITKITNNKILFDGEDWKINERNLFGVYKDKLIIGNFDVSSGDRNISVVDISNKGVEIKMSKFEIEHINDFINYDKLFFSGVADLKLRVENVFEYQNSKVFVEIPDFRINGDEFGQLTLKVLQESKDLFDVDLAIVRDTQLLGVTGYFDNSLDFVNVDIDIQKYPMSFFEYIIQDGISETEGTTDLTAKIHGKLSDMKLSGIAKVNNAGVRVDYLGAFYSVDNQTVKITESFIDLNNLILKDERNNQAIVKGGLNHSFLSDIRAALTISSPQFIGLNTTNLDNPLYYGLGQGDLSISFNGPFDVIDIRVNAITGPNTQLFIPISNAHYGIEESFVKFDYKNSQLDSVGVRDLVKKMQESGVDFEMNLTFTPAAEVQVIYDPVTNNVLIGRGRGSLRLKIKRDGEFSVYGNYYVESGRYLYTAYGFIAKPFEIRNGGTVTWTGDPINATLNVTADYPGLRAPLNVFLREYIQSSSLESGEFTQARDVDLTLLLAGTLFTPTINFGIDFPNLTGELRTLAQSKVRTLQTSENGINNQVVGLLVFRNFLPDDNPFQLSGQTIGQTGNNTITEFLTSQLSLLFTEYLSDKLKDNSVLSGIDFDIAVAQNTSVLTDQNADVFTGFVDFVPDEIQLNLRNRFKNDNFVLNVGGNYVRENPIGTAENYLTGDFSLDWFITDDKRLKLRFYGNYDFDEAYGQRRQKYGFGLNFRREFGSINNFETILDELIKQINKEAKDNSSVK